MSQTKNSSYRKMFSQLKDSEDIFEVQVIERIRDDYEKYHFHDLQSFEKLRNDGEVCCPYCGSEDVIRHGSDRNGVARMKCKGCGRTFNRITDSLFFSSKVNIKAWFAFLECILSGTSVKAACIAAKISQVTGSRWMKKIFDSLSSYQDSVMLENGVFIDETYVHVDASELYHKEEIGYVKKVPEKPRGISRNQICILVATDGRRSFAEIVGTGRPTRTGNLEICRRHIRTGATLIGDEDTSLTYAANELGLSRRMVKGYTQEAFDLLSPVDQLCNRLKFFINKHRGFKKELLRNYLDLFIFTDNELNIEKDLYVVTMKLLKIMFSKKIVKANVAHDLV